MAERVDLLEHGPSVDGHEDGPASLSKVAVFVGVVRRSGPHLLEASLIPTALFYCSLVLLGLGAALIAALGWVYLAVLSRLLRGKPVPPLLVLATIGVTVRTATAVTSGSTFLYFAQPVLGSVVMGVVFLASVALGRPMVERLALEFWPLTPAMLDRPAVGRLLRRLTYLWALVNLAIGTITFALLLALPLSTFVAVKQLVSLGITGVGIAVTIDRAVHTARREGFLSHRVKADGLLTQASS